MYVPYDCTGQWVPSARAISLWRVCCSNPEGRGGCLLYRDRAGRLLPLLQQQPTLGLRLPWSQQAPPVSCQTTYCCEQVLAHGPQESRGPRGEPYSRVDDEFTGLAQVLGQQGPPHVTAQCVLEKQERKTSPQWTWFLSRHNTQSNKQSAILRTL